MKKFLMLAVALFLSATFILTGCGKSETGLANNPPTDAKVISNGGMAVAKGEYLYFVNGYQTHENLVKGTDNIWDTQTYGSIYRVKVSNNDIAHDDNGFMLNAELVVPQIIGTENASFYIFGDYIYYATPNMQKDSAGNVLNLRSNLCRVNINGLESTNKVLYQTYETLTTDNWTMYEVDGTVYMIVNDNGKLLSINANAKDPSVTTMAEDFTSTALIKTDTQLTTDVNYNQTALIDGVNNYVYYTRAVTEDDNNTTGNILARVKLGTSTEEIVFQNSNSYTIVESKNNCLYYTVAKASGVTTLNKLELGKTVSAANETVLSYATYTETVILNANNEHYVGNDIVAINSSNQIVLVKNVNNNPVETVLYSSTATSEDGTATISTLGLYGSTLFVLESGVIRYINVLDVNPVMHTVETDAKTILTTTNVFLDYDGRNVYFYAAYTPEDGSEANYYLNRTDLHASDVTSEFVGVFNEDHVPAQPEEPEDGSEAEQWIK